MCQGQPKTALNMNQLFHMMKPKSRYDPRKNMDLLVSAFEENYPRITAFLPWEEQLTTKLICRGIYYISITSEVWTGLRLEVLDRKMQLFEDIDFVQEQPKLISKQEKQIRIHSLKKNNQGLKLREASNVKEKKVALNTINNELPFRSTEIGFKRLMRSTIQPKQKIISSKEVSNVMLDLVQIPRQWSSKDLIIDVKDPWSANIQRAANLCTIARKWNEFHHRIITELKEVEKDMAGLVKKCIKIDKSTTDYFKLFQNQLYKTVRALFDGAQQQLLIDDQLNKLGRIFVKNHQELAAVAQTLEPFISKTHQSCSKLSRQSTQSSGTYILERLSAVEEIIQQWAKIGKQSPELIRYLAKSLFEIIDSILEDCNSMEVEVLNDTIPLCQVNVNHLSRRSQFFEVLFESYEGVCTGLLKLCEGGEEENIGMNLTAGKFKNLKYIAHNLWSISKYFSKLIKQLQTREKKGSAGGKATIIRNFLQSYQNYRVPYSLIDWKNPNRSQKQVQELKQRVNGLKGLMQGQ